MLVPNGHFLHDRKDIHRLRNFLINQRKISGWTQEELSERSGVSVRTIRNLETGSNTNPRRTSVDLLLSAFGATATAAETAFWGSTGWPAVPEQRTESHLSHALELPPWYGPWLLNDPLVGRQTDLRHVVATVQRSRLVALTGAGGVGKSRLAHAAAVQLRPLFREGVAVADLHDCPPEHLDSSRAGSELMCIVRELDGEDGFLRGGSWTGSRLLVLDNAEHVVQHTARIARNLLSEHPGLHLLITSRRTPSVGAAETWDVEPLRVDGPEDGETAVPSAVEHFLRRVQAGLPTLDLSDHLPLVTRLCRLLDGIPLALDIAAQRLRSLPLTSLVQSGNLFPLLDQVDAGRLSRHRTLSESVRWSYDLLPAPHQELLHELVALQSPFSLDDVLRVQQGQPDATQVAHLLADLADASLVHIERRLHYTYRVHALVRHWLLTHARRPSPAGGAAPLGLGR
ncbi:helix-turn-helix domain-containing protein [Streptomyces albulus]|nr:helix-turn-helix domain-containing protein [Streptomyces noursei]